MIINPGYILKEKIVFSTNPKRPISEHLQLQQNGIDVRLEKAEEIVGDFTLQNNKAIHCTKHPCRDDDSDCLYFFAGHSYDMTCIESTKIPNGFAAMVYGRSTLNRNGIFVRSSFYDTGFDNKIGLTAFFFVNAKIQLGSRIAQIVFSAADNNGKYAGQYKDK